MVDTETSRGGGGRGWLSCADVGHRGASGALAGRLPRPAGPHHPLKRCHAVRCLRVGREQVIVPVGVQRIDDEHVCRGRRPLGGMIVDAAGHVLDPLQGRGKRKRIAANLGSDTIGLVLAGSTDRHLHQCCGQRREDHACQCNDQTHLSVAAPAEEQGEIGQHRNRAREGRGDGHDQRVAVADVGKLVGDHSGQLFPVECLHEACGDGHGGAIGASASGEGVGLVRLEDIDRRGRHICCRSEVSCHISELAVRAFGGLGAVEAQHQLVGVPPRQQVHDGCNGQGDDSAAGATKEPTDARKQGGHKGHQKRCADQWHAKVLKD